MIEKFFVRADGSWIGAYTGHFLQVPPEKDEDGNIIKEGYVDYSVYVVDTPVDGIEVPSAPELASQVWDFETKTFSPLE